MTKPILFHYQHNNDDPNDYNLYVSTEYAFSVNVEGCNRMIAHLEKTDPEFKGDLQAWLDYSETFQFQSGEMEAYGIHEVCLHSLHDEIFTHGFWGGEIEPARHVEFINEWRQYFVRMAGEENVSPALMVDSRAHYYDTQKCSPGQVDSEPFDSTSLNVYNVLHTLLQAQVS